MSCIYWPISCSICFSSAFFLLFSNFRICVVSWYFSSALRSCFFSTSQTDLRCEPVSFRNSDSRRLRPTSILLNVSYINIHIQLSNFLLFILFFIIYISFLYLIFHLIIYRSQLIIYKLILIYIIH